MTPGEAEARIRSWSESWSEGDLSEAIDLLAEDAAMSAYMPEGVVHYRGREAILGYLRDFVGQWAHYRVEVDEVEEISDGLILVSGRQLGTGRLSGIEISEPVFVAHVLRGEEIAGWHWHVERDKALEFARASALN